MTHRLQDGLTPAPHSQPIMSHANEQDSRPTCSSLSSAVIHVLHETIRERDRAGWNRQARMRYEHIPAEKMNYFQ